MSIALNQPDTGQQIKYLMLGAAISGVLFSAGIALPFVGFAAGFIAASPISYVRIMRGRKTAVLAVLVAAILTGLAFKPVVGAWYLAQCGLIGILVPELLLSGRKASSTLLVSTAIATALTAVLVIIVTVLSGKGLATVAQQEIVAGMDQAIKVYEQQKGITPQDIDALKQIMNTVSSVMIRIYPALATLNLLLVSGITLLILKRIAPKTVTELVAGHFRDFKTPEPFIWLLIISGFAMLAPTTLVTTPALNILVLMLILYFFQGLAVILTLSDRTQFSGALRVFIALLLLTQPYLVPVVAIAGIFDLWGEFRTPNNKQEKNL